MSKCAVRWVLLLAVLLGAGAARFTGLNWDGGIGAHPDERYLVGVAEGLHWPSRINPLAVDGSFAYGHLPVYLAALGIGLARCVDPLLVGRVLAALLGLVTVGLTIALGWQVFGWRVGLLGGALVGLAVVHVQQDHFYTAEALLVPLGLGALLFATRLAENGRTTDGLLAGALAGLAVGSKAVALLLALPLGVACLLSGSDVRRRWLLGLACGGAALGAFALTNPFAVASFPTFWRNVTFQAAIARGAVDVPYTRQFHGTWPYAYQAAQLLRWGMGWLAGLAGIAGLACAAYRLLRRSASRPELVLLSWTLPYLAFVGVLYAKFPRYLLPVTPVLALYAGALLVGPGIARTIDDGIGKAVRASRLRHGLATGLRALPALLVLGAALLRCCAFVNLYRESHPWTAASRWLSDRATMGSTVAVEEWDHPLPAGPEYFDVRTLPVFDEDTGEKWDQMASALGDADYVVIASRRGYGTLARWPERYPQTARYYHMLFGGDLGFEPVACFGRLPWLSLVAFGDDPTSGLEFTLPELCFCGAGTEGDRPSADCKAHVRVGRLDESFVVYDHPRAIVFRRTDRVPGPGEMRALLGQSS